MSTPLVLLLIAAALKVGPLVRPAVAAPLLSQAASSSVSAGDELRAAALVWRHKADTQLEAGDVRAARLSIRKAISLLHQNQSSLDYAAVLNTVALVDFADRQYAHAERTWNRALAILSSLHAEDHTTATTIRAHLALIRAMQGRYSEAEVLLLNAIATSGSGPEVVEYRDRLARTWLLAGQYAKAEQEARSGLELAARTSGVENARALPLWVSLGTALAAQKRHEEADMSMRRALAIAVRLYGPRHAFTGSVLEEYSRVMKQAGRKREAEKLKFTAHEILKTELDIRANTIDVTESQRR